MHHCILLAWIVLTPFNYLDSLMKLGLTSAGFPSFFGNEMCQGGSLSGIFVPHIVPYEEDRKINEEEYRGFQTSNARFSFRSGERIDDRTRQTHRPFACFFKVICNHELPPQTFLCN